MGDKYNAGQAGVVGPGGHAHDMTFNQIWNQMGNNWDLPTLAEELAKLRSHLKQQATEPEHDTTIGEYKDLLANYRQVMLPCSRFTLASDLSEC